jgi:hypothetical protein
MVPARASPETAVTNPCDEMSLVMSDWNIRPDLFSVNRHVHTSLIECTEMFTAG